MLQATDKMQEQVTPIRAEKLKWPASIAINLRSKRLVLFKALIAQLPRPLHILDVGGTQKFWEVMGLIHDDIRITIINIEPDQDLFPNITSIIGDARNMHEFQDQEFEVVFSNSVIEHVGSFEDQRAMAQEIQRVGKRYIVQTPNRYFPIEPHVLIPFFQFFPLGLKILLATHTPNWGWKASHIEELDTIRLMQKKELISIFPGSRIYKEKFLRLTKSFILYKGW